MQSLHNRAVVIIGGTTGLGLSAAKACVAAGASVVVCGRNPESAASAEASLGRRRRGCFVGDATDPATADAAIRLAIDAFGRFDALYHVAGGSGRRAGDGPLHEVTDDGIDATLRHNLTSLIYSNRARGAGASWNAAPAGRCSTWAACWGWSPSPKFFATHVYAAAKSAVIGFTKSCAAYYAPQDIRFNVIAPALVDTPMATAGGG